MKTEHIFAMSLFNADDNRKENVSRTFANEQDALSLLRQQKNIFEELEPENLSVDYDIDRLYIAHINGSRNDGLPAMSIAIAVSSFTI